MTKHKHHQILKNYELPDGQVTCNNENVYDMIIILFQLILKIIAIWNPDLSSVNFKSKQQLCIRKEKKK